MAKDNGHLVAIMRWKWTKKPLFSAILDERKQSAKILNSGGMPVISEQNVSSFQNIF